MFPVTFSQIHEQGSKDFIKSGSFRVSALLVKHLVLTIGIRVELPDDRNIAYSCDTEPCPTVVELAEGADVLLQEAAGLAKGHSSPEQAGEIAAQAGVKKLILIHYDNRIAESELLMAARRKFSGEVILAQDMMAV